jgi:hypothetical protein
MCCDGCQAVLQAMMISQLKPLPDVNNDALTTHQLRRVLHHKAVCCLHQQWHIKLGTNPQQQLNLVPALDLCRSWHWV